RRVTQREAVGGGGGSSVVQLRLVGGAHEAGGERCRGGVSVAARPDVVVEGREVQGAGDDRAGRDRGTVPRHPDERRGVRGHVVHGGERDGQPIHRLADRLGREGAVEALAGDGRTIGLTVVEEGAVLGEHAGAARVLAGRLPRLRVLVDEAVLRV